MGNICKKKRSENNEDSQVSKNEVSVDFEDNVMKGSVGKTSEPLGGSQGVGGTAFTMTDEVMEATVEIVDGIGDLGKDMISEGVDVVIDAGKVAKVTFDLDYKPAKYDRWDLEDKVVVRKKLAEIEEQIEVGDCIFLWDENIIARGPQFFQSCNVAHVVQVYDVLDEEWEDEFGNKRMKKIPYIESSINTDGVKIINGVQKHEDISETFELFQIAWIMKLNKEHKERLKLSYLELREFHDEKLRSHARYSVAGAVTSVFGNWPLLNVLYFINKELGPSKNHYFCSGFVVAAFVEIGLIKTEEVKKFQWNLCTPKEMLKFDIWEKEVVQIHGYGDDERIVYPIDCVDFLSLTPQEWNRNPSEFM